MADDGMLLNFELGDAPLTSQVKFKGGRWRDRVKAQKSVTKWQNHTGAENGDDDSSARPTKRSRTEDGPSGREFKMPRTGPVSANYTPSHAMKTGQISSSLFTSNPAAVTTFDEPEEVPEPAEPSNAPLSEETNNFLALGLSRRVAEHLSSKLQMKAPTAIQKKTIPKLVEQDCDAFLQAETGSGKTLAYLLPIVQRIMALSLNEDGTTKDTKVHRNSGLFAIIMAPTRELCTQIQVVLEKILRCAPWLVCSTVIGGESKKAEKARIRKGVNILVATPGRLTDHLLNTKVLDVGTVRWLVLDEGDRMMEMGFEDDLRDIVTRIRQDKLLRYNKEGVLLDGILPSRRVTVLCSATMKMNVQKLGEISLENAEHIIASKSEMENDEAGGANEANFSAPSQLKQQCLIVPAKLRLVTLIAYLRSAFARKGTNMKVIIFISCADSVDFHFELLKATAALELDSDDEDAPPARKIDPNTQLTVSPAAYITSPANTTVMIHKLHGSLAQPVRTATLNAFTNCKEPAVLISTDIASRGLDVPSVDIVIEYDPAFVVDDHVHRIGRTARAGRAGKAVLFLQPGPEEGYLSLLNTATQKVTPENYIEILQKGLMTPLNLPTPASGDQPEKSSWQSRAEALQLHFEQRLLATSGFEPADDKSKAKGSKSGANNARGAGNRNAKPKEDPLLIAARQAFKSHICAYATHVKEERVFFDKAKLHLGHMAKSYGLREAPGGIGGGVSKRTHKPAAAQKGSSSKVAGPAASSSAWDGDLDMGAVDQEAAAKRMKAQNMAIMNASNEFNIG
ncbi:P-loop containing nucleoside triphosphate hydrolase protein [Cercophora scortea]|uniref:ATP-dependent RNA helicase n=1 Tax=Cercophora scortea TaxID=314031 RepID=A0AAE0IG48_9PEZI|nr:P-loop containing nucleoside triphosphate hydrolase protein [Cercophora scortea]